MIKSSIIIKLQRIQIGYIFGRNMSSTSKVSGNCCVAVCQMTATNNKEKNLESVRRLITKAVEKDAKMIFLPEGCDYIGSNINETNELAETLDGDLMKEYKTLAEKHKVWLSIGGMHEKTNTELKLKNAHVLIDSKGNVASVYRKLHLFVVSIPEKNINLKESDNVISGNEIVQPIQTPAGFLGLSICYDLRFPEISILLRKLGASILTFPSAFTNATGQAHWEILLRARAIENQCYVIAAAQYGQHNTKRISFGNAMIVDPWGRIIAECPKYSENEINNEGVAIANINLDLIGKIREEIPVFQHRRNDMYQLDIVNRPYQIFNENFMFADKNIPFSTVFYQTQFSFAFTNIKCVVPGHVLVSSKRVAKRLNDLNCEEAKDLFITAIKVQKVVENVYKSDSSTICVQDGKNAGQTVAHVHFHVLPRKKGDFENNDDIYGELAKHDKENNPQSLRSLEEMSAEAEMLKKYFVM